MDTSVFFQSGAGPATAPDSGSLAVIAGIALAGTVAGGALLNRRDLVGA